MHSKYDRPPITEAIIELAVEAPIQKEELDKVRARAVEEYPFGEELASIGMSFELAKASAQVKQEWAGHKLSNIDRTEVLSLQPHVFSFSRLAPYPGWDMFRSKAREQWDKWKRIVGRQKFSRIGVRFINRIDIPVADPNAQIQLEDYFNLYVKLPNFDRGPMTNFTIQAQMPLKEDGCVSILNSSPVPSPLVNNVSFILDIDVARQAEIPQRDDDLWAQIERIRDYKNRIFETSITERTRELFSK